LWILLKEFTIQTKHSLPCFPIYSFSHNLKQNTKIKVPPFLKNILALSLGSVASQGLNFLFLPFLSRLYNPEEFGIFYTFVGITQTFILISTLKYEKSIILPKNKIEADGLVLLTFLIITIYTLLIAAVLGCFQLFNINISNIGKYALLIPLAVLSYSYLSVITLWYQREERFKLISLILMLQSSCIIAFNILFAFLHINQNGLIWGYVLGCFFLVLGISVAQHKRFFSLYKNGKKISLLGGFKKYIDFPKYYLLYDLSANASNFLLPVIITSYYSQLDCGLFSMAYRILMVPIIIISGSISSVFMVNANKTYQIDACFNNLYKKTFIKVLITGLIIYTIIFFIGSSLITTFLGQQWKNVDIFVKILSCLLFFEFTSFVFRSNTYVIVQKQKIGLLVQGISTMLGLSSLIFFAYLGINNALIIFTALSISFACVNLFVTYNLSKKNI
jgi:O-antigen/teichoic acid export membrane protein